MRHALLLLATTLYAQEFEVASIKPSPDLAALRAARQTSYCGTQLDDARVELTCTPLATLIMRAYRIEPFQLTAPDWMKSARFDIRAKLPEGATQAQIPAMLQALLAERFALVARESVSEEPVYSLAPGKGGAKLKEAAAGDLTSERPFPHGADGRILLYISNSGANGWQTYSRLNGMTVFEAPRMTMLELTRVLARQVDLPVVDMTGLAGAYEISLPVPHGPNGVMPASSTGGRGGPVLSDQAALPSGVDIFKAIEKLGLRLEKSKAPIERIVVEHADKMPTGN